MELSALGAFVGNAVIGGGVGVQGHGIRVNGQDIVGRNAGAVLQGFYPGFCRRQKGNGEHLVSRGGADQGGKGVFPVRGGNYIQVVGVQVPGDDEAHSGIPEIAVKDILLFRRAVIVTAPQAFPELHGRLQGAVGENQAVSRNGVGLASVAFNPCAEVHELVRSKVNIHEIQGSVFMADTVVQFSGGQPLDALPPRRQEEFPELFRPERKGVMIAAHGIKGDAFFSQNVVEFLAFGESLDGGASFDIRHVPYLDDHVHVVFQDFPIEGFDEVDCYSLASFHALGGVVRIADDRDFPWGCIFRQCRLKQEHEK